MSEELTVEQKYQRLRELHEAANEAIDTLHKALDMAGEENRTLYTQLQHSEQALTQQKVIVGNHLAISAQEKQNLEMEVAGLRSEIKALKKQRPPRVLPTPRLCSQCNEELEN